MEINTGIPEEERKNVAKGLSHLLADSYTLYLKTHNFHWNVTGPMFQSLHAMFEEHYTELATAVDEIAERIRALGEPAPGSYAAFARLSSIQESEDVPNASEMVKQLVEAHEAVAKTARGVLPIADAGDDEVTMGLLADRLAVHEKTAWMLRSMIA
ncbi:Dps family protein [Pelagibius sp. Alg239-R121]|uniref:Dps family protein n=1 Tax=Pelagibius sp. Alg239-R121 TaxID=2993448 RepID=UPI0024A75E1C|nr:Dps family protein [Pelagibius sp. Alg239-R121]